MTLYGYSKKGYSLVGFTTEDYDAYWTQINMNAWRPRVQIYDHQDNKLLLHEYNAFKDDNDLIIEKIKTQEQLGTAGTFSFTVRDNERTLDRSKVGNACKVVISMAKNSYGPWRNISSGFIENPQIMRDSQNGLRYTFSGYGSGIIIQETLTNFRKTATRVSLGSAEPDTNDHTMQVKSLMRSLLQDTDHLVSATKPLVETGNFSLNISEDLTTFIPLVSIRDHPVATAMNFLSDRTGNLWGVDPNDTVWAWYPQNTSSGVVLKTFKPSERSIDRNYNVSYFFGPWDYNVPIDQESFGNVLISYANTSPRSGGAFTTVGSTTGTGGGGNPTGQPIGTTEVIQQLPMNIPKVTRLSVMLQKIGPLKSRFVNGIIYSDIAGQNKPNLNNILATFQLDISRLVIGVPTAVFSTQMSNVATVPVGSKMWISLQYVGPRNDAQTVSWLNSGPLQQPSDLYYGTREVAATTSTPQTGEGPAPFTLNNDKTFTYAIFYETKTKVIVRDPVSIMRYGEVERFIDVTWTTDFKTINDLLFLMLNTTAKPPMSYNLEKVSIPDAPLRVGKLVTVLDDTAGLGAGTATTAMATSAGYEFDAYNPGFGPGTYFCDLQISGLYDWLTYENATTRENLSCSPILTSY